MTNINELRELSEVRFIDAFVYWRNTYGINPPFEKILQRGELPFKHQVIQQLNKGTNSLRCPLCGGNEIVLKPDSRKPVYCLCALVSTMNAAWSLGRRESFIEPFHPGKFSFKMSPGIGNAQAQASLKRAVDAVRTFAKGLTPPWLLLMGTQGCGKTHLLTQVAKAFWPLAFMVSGAVLENAVFVALKEKRLSELTVLLQAAELLIIDDMGMEYGSAMIKSVIEAVIDHRWVFKLPTIVASNFNRDELYRYMPRAASRLLDTRLVTILPITAGDFRRG